MDQRPPAPSITYILENCLGCKWTMHVIRSIQAGICRPGQLERSTEGLSAKVLAERLEKLQRFQLVEKQTFAQVPPRVEYRLTGLGTRVLALLNQMEQVCEEYGLPPEPGSKH